jgi:hypothetical protein
MWNDVMNALYVWNVLPGDSTGEINLSLLVGDICIDDPSLARGIWLLSDGRDIQQSLAGGRRDDPFV